LDSRDNGFGQQFALGTAIGDIADSSWRDLGCQVSDGVIMCPGEIFNLDTEVEFSALPGMRVTLTRTPGARKRLPRFCGFVFSAPGYTLA
jgi:hypothetical protein